MDQGQVLNKKADEVSNVKNVIYPILAIKESLEKDLPMRRSCLLERAQVFTKIGREDHS